MLDLTTSVEPSSFDAIWCSHNIEHLHDHEVPLALEEFRRVLKPDGFAFITCPDLDQVVRLIAEKGVEAVAYVSPAGPIRALDILFGHGKSISVGNHYMCHQTGFTLERMGRVLMEAGFPESYVTRGTNYDLWAIAMMPEADPKKIEALVGKTAEAFIFQDIEG